MSDQDVRALERADPKDPRARAWKLRHGIGPLEPEVGDVVEVGYSYTQLTPNSYAQNPSPKRVLSTSFMGFGCPVRAIVVGHRTWKLSPGRSPIVVPLPPAEGPPTVASRYRCLVVEVGRPVGALGKGKESGDDG